MRKLLLVILLISISIQRVAACDCKTIPLNEKAIESVEFIFLGKVVAISGCDKTAKVTFSIDELFRGKSYANAALEFDCSSDCQMSFVPGQTWLIYAKYKKYGEATVDFCSYSRQQFKKEEEDYNTLSHGLTFSAEEQWLKKTQGLHNLNVRDVQEEQHHENIRPQGYSILLYMGGGLLGLILIYFISQKFLK